MKSVKNIPDTNYEEWTHLKRYFNCLQCRIYHWV